MWFGIVFFILFMFYFFNHAFQEGVNNLVAAAGHWLAKSLHLPTWAINIARWLWERFRAGFLLIMTVLVLLGVVWVYAYKTGNSQVLLVAMTLTSTLLMLVAIAAQTYKGFKEKFGSKDGIGAIGKMAISIVMWIMVNFAILSIPGDWYFNHLWVPAVVTGLLLMFMLRGWYNNQPDKYTAGTFITLFIGFLIFSGYMNWEAGKIRLPGWLQNKANEIRLQKEVDGQMLLATFIQGSVAYKHNSRKKSYEPTNIQYRPGSTVLVSKPDSSPDASHGESMLEIIKQNKYGDFFGTRLYVPARKLEYMSPSQLREEQKKKLANRPDTVAVLTGVGTIWYPPEYGRQAVYWVIVPPKTMVSFRNFKAGRNWYKPMDNRANARKRIYKWTVVSPAETIDKLVPRTAQIIILKKKNKEKK